MIHHPNKYTTCLCFSEEEKTEASKWRQLWQDGLLLSGAQNFARELMETPSNLMTPTVFADTLSKRLSDLQNVEVYARYELDNTQFHFAQAFLVNGVH